jgi:hypothetical protein
MQVMLLLKARNYHVGLTADNRFLGSYLCLIFELFLRVLNQKHLFLDDEQYWLRTYAIKQLQISSFKLDWLQ